MKSDKFVMAFFITTLLLLTALSVHAQSETNPEEQIQATGGVFTLTKTVIAGGGQSMGNVSPAINQQSTIGQALAGIKSTGGQFSLYSGFWTPESLAPTAATVTAGGRVLSTDGRGIRNVLVKIAFPTGETRVTVSGAFGNFRFAEIPSGQTYVFEVVAKRYSFALPAQILTIYGDTQDIDFIAAALSPPNENRPQK